MHIRTFSCMLGREMQGCGFDFKVGGHKGQRGYVTEAGKSEGMVWFVNNVDFVCCKLPQRGVKRKR